MNFFIQQAHAQGASGGGNLIGGLLPIIIIFGVFWFLLIRPQQKKQKAHRQMVEALAKGDEIVTNGGLLGKIIDVGDAFVTLEIANGTQVRVQRTAIATLMPKGTVKSP